MIPEETIREVLSKTDIVELVSSYFPLKRTGTEYVALCPFHSEKTPSFSVSPSKQMYYCFGCGAGGSAARFLMDYENIDFPSALQRLGEKVGVVIAESEASPEQAKKRRWRDRLLQVNREAAKWFHNLLLKKEIARHARDYLKVRGLDIEAARTWQLGYAPEANAPLFTWAESQNFSRRVLVAAGLAAERQDERGNRVVARFRNRLMFPICNDYGEVIAFSGRTLDPDAPMAKYVNSPETELFSKSKTLFGFHLTKRPIHAAGHVIVCEGQIDLITCYQSGVQNMVAPLGTAFTQDHARLLKRNTEEVVLCFDADNAGFKAAVRTFQVLTENNLFVRAVEMPPGEDPDSLIRKEGVTRFRERIAGAVDFFEFHIDRRSAGADLHSPRDQRQIALELAENVALLSDKLMQDTVINSVAARLGISNEEFRRSVHAASEKRKRWERGRRPDTDADAPTRAAFHDPCAEGLCQMLLIDKASKDWFREAVASSPLPANLVDGELLRVVAAGNFDPETPASVLAFLGTLPRDQERMLSRVIAKPPCGNHLQAARDHWKRLQLDGLNALRVEKEGKLKQGGLSPVQCAELFSEIQNLTAQIQALQRQP